MTMYNMLFGMNQQADLLLAVIGLRKNDIERFRDVFVSESGNEIIVHTRTGGGNREGYPNELMRSKDGFVRSVDDDYDSTYCDDTFKIPQEFIEDVKNMSDILENGMRPEFGKHLLKTINREATEGDKETEAYENEARELAKTKHFKANGHTFVPVDDSAMETALKLAEANHGKLRSAWGIMPLALKVSVDHKPYPNAKDESSREHLVRAEINYDYGWNIDANYWEHCKKRWGDKYPLSMAIITKEVEAKTNAKAA